MPTTCGVAICALAFAAAHFALASCWFVGMLVRRHADWLEQNESQNPTEKVGESKVPLVTSVCLLTRARTAVSASVIAEGCVDAVWTCERRRLSARKVVDSATIWSVSGHSLLG